MVLMDFIWQDWSALLRNLQIRTPQYWNKKRDCRTRQPLFFVGKTEVTHQKYIKMTSSKTRFTYLKINTHFMKSIFKVILLFIFLACGLVSNAQTHKRPYLKEEGKYELTLRTYNHAEYLGTGDMLYKITDSSLTIINTPALSQQDTVIFSKIIEKDSIKPIKAVRLDGLRELYYNDFVMGVSGDEYHILVTRGKKIKEIRLHHYYQPQIARLIRRMNKVIPDQYKIRYLDKDTRQKCELCRDFKHPPK